MKKQVIAIIGLGYWGTIVTNTLVSMNIFKKIYIYSLSIENFSQFFKTDENKKIYLHWKLNFFTNKTKKT